ncbi:MAG: hypothetical protein ACK41O_23395 [Runella zeae]
MTKVSVVKNKLLVRQIQLKERIAELTEEINQVKAEIEVLKQRPWWDGWAWWRRIVLGHGLNELMGIVLDHRVELMEIKEFRRQL